MEDIVEGSQLIPEEQHELDARGPSYQPLINDTFKRVPPIKGLFDPDEEVKKLFSTGKEGRREAISEFKDKLSRQREAWGLCRRLIEERINNNPDTPREEMIAIVRQFAAAYGFTERHINDAEELISEYIAHHEGVRQIRREYPNDIDLINRLTGMSFTEADAGNFVVTVGPMTIEISCPREYITMVVKNVDPATLPFGTINGVSGLSNGTPPVFYIFVNNDPRFDRNTLLLHEREHAKNALLMPRKSPEAITDLSRRRVFEEMLKHEKESEDKLYEQYKTSDDPEQRSFFLKEYLISNRGRIFDLAKDEIIAMYKDGYDLARYVDYFFSATSHSYTAKYMAKFNAEHEKDSDPLWKDHFRRIMVEEYENMVRDAIYSFNALVWRYNCTTGMAIALLSDKSLTDWPNAVKRFRDAKRARFKE